MSKKLIDSLFYSILQSESLEESNWFANHLLINKQNSKEWLVKELLKVHVPKNTLILGSWYATILPQMLHNNNKFTCVDIDTKVKRLSDIFNNRYYDTNPVKTISMGAKDFLNCSDVSIYDTIINTSCEHMSFDMLEVIHDRNAVYALQSNDYFSNAEHINCKHSLEEFISSTGLTNIMYSGEMKMRKYTRFMVIGKL